MESRHAQLVSRQFQSDPGPVKPSQHPNWRVLFLAIFFNILLSMTKTEALRIGSHISSRPRTCLSALFFIQNIDLSRVLSEWS